MNRIDFMDRLAGLLVDMPESERNEAIQYYQDYFDDAGIENEQEVLTALGTPEELAAAIKEGLQEGSADKGEFSETGFSGWQRESARHQVVKRQEAGGYEQASDQAAEERQPGKQEQAERQGNSFSGEALNQRYRGKKAKKSGLSGGAIALIVICALLAGPVIIPFALIAAVILVVLAVIFLPLLLLFLVVGVVCVAAGILGIFKSVMELFVVPAAAVIALGASLMSIGIGILLVLGMWWLLTKGCPKIFRACADFCSRHFGQKRK